MQTKSNHKKNKKIQDYEEIYDAYDKSIDSVYKALTDTINDNKLLKKYFKLKTGKRESQIRLIELRVKNNNFISKIEIFYAIKSLLQLLNTLKIQQITSRETLKNKHKQIINCNITNEEYFDTIIQLKNEFDSKINPLFERLEKINSMIEKIIFDNKNQEMKKIMKKN